VALKREASKLAAEGWELQREQTELQKDYRAFGASRNGANGDREAALMDFNARICANGAALLAVNRRLSLEFGVDR
jgi:hypothetical protein